MPKQLYKLTPVSVKNAKKVGFHADGGNLYLQVAKGGTKSWVFRYMRNGEPKVMGLGSIDAVPLAKQKNAPEIESAREKAAYCRSLLASGIDPLDARRESREKIKVAAAKSITFEQCATAYIDSHKAGWRNEKHIWQWSNSLERLVYPTFGHLPVQDIDVGLVMKVLEPIWKTKTETATRVRGRIESIIDWATVRGYREGENPARWRGRLQSLLPAPSKIRKVRHHPALPYQQINTLVQRLQTQENLGAKALLLTIFTAARTNETLKAKWEEFDLENKLWIVPDERMKMRREHRVPLSEPAMKILKELYAARISEYVFPGARGKHLSNTAMLMLMRRMGWSDFTVHGFRSSLRDWAAEQTNYPSEIAKMSLAHAVDDKVDAAYFRSDLFDKRRLLMNEWGKYCLKLQPKSDKGCDNVVSISGKNP